MDVLRADNSFTNWQNLPVNNPIPDLLNINAYTKFGENPLIFIQVIVQKQKRLVVGKQLCWKFIKFAH